MLQHKFAELAKEDIVDVIDHAELVHDWEAYLRYQRLIRICIGNLLENPQAIGVQYTHRNRIFRYHISHGKQQAKNEGFQEIKNPKHYIFFEILENGVLHILRILHERRDFECHL